MGLWRLHLGDPGPVADAAAEASRTLPGPELDDRAIRLR